MINGDEDGGGAASGPSLETHNVSGSVQRILHILSHFNIM